MNISKNDRITIGLVNNLSGAIILTILMQAMTLLGMPQHTWMLFLPLLLFFALGADLKVIPSMVVGFACGQVWAVVNGLVSNAFGTISGGNPLVSQLLPTVLVIFCVLTVHQTLLAGTIAGNIPSLFLGMAESFFVLFMGVADLTPFHLLGFFCYGLVLATVLVLGGGAICGAIFGKERAMAALTPAAPKGV